MGQRAAKLLLLNYIWPCWVELEQVAPSFSEEIPIWCTPRSLHMPSQVGFHWTSVHHQSHCIVGSWWLCYWCYSWQTVHVSAGFDLWSLCVTLLLLLQPWLFLLFDLSSEGSHYWERHQTFWSPTVWKLSHSMYYFRFLVQDFLILLWCNTLNFLNLLKVLVLN
jgi:hypothetical protein